MEGGDGGFKVRVRRSADPSEMDPGSSTPRRKTRKEDLNLLKILHQSLSVRSAPTPVPPPVSDTLQGRGRGETKRRRRGEIFSEGELKRVRAAMRTAMTDLSVPRPPRQVKSYAPTIPSLASVAVGARTLNSSRDLEEVRGRGKGR